MGRNHSIVHVHDILQMCPLYVIHSLVIYAQEHKLGIHSTKGAVAELGVLVRNTSVVLPWERRTNLIRECL